MTPDPARTRIDLAHEPPFRLGSLEVRPATRELVAPNGRQVLEPRIMQVLVALARRRGEVVSRDDLIASCWEGRIVGDDSIDRCIGSVRRLAERYGGFSIETIIRVGYRLTETAPAPHGSPWRKRFARPWAWIVASLIVMATIAGVAWLAGGRLRPASEASEVRVAVLPFDAVGPGFEPRDFAQGLRDEIVGVLTRNQVQTVSRQEAGALRGSDRDAAMRRLDVGLLLDGAVQRDGQTLQVRMRLDDPRSHTVLWSRDFEGPADDPDKLRAQVAAHVTDTTYWAASNRLGVGSGVDPVTLSLYLEAGDQALYGGDRSIEIYRQVVQRAPSFSYGHSGLAIALVLTANSAPPGQRNAILAEVRKEAHRALDLDPHNGEGYLALATTLPPLAWREEEALIAKAAAADPSLSYVYGAYAMLLADVGRTAEALPMQKRGVATEPYWPRGQAYLARRLADVGRGEEARATIANTAHLWPDHADVRAVESELALEATTDTAAIEAAAGSSDPRLAVTALTRLGRLNAVFAQANRLKTTPGPANSYGYQDVTRVLFAPATRSLRRDPRFMRLAADLGLVDYWRTTGKWPDFCREPGLPYDCKAEAARLAAQPAG